VVSPSYRDRAQPQWENSMGPRHVPAEITRARLRSRPMMIAPILHVSCRSAACPSESVAAVLVELFQVSLKLGLECFPEVIALVKEACTNLAHAFFLAHPSDQLQLPFMFGTILAFTVLVVPVSAEFFMYRPILLLTFDALRKQINDQVLSLDDYRSINSYRSMRPLCTLNICLVSRRLWFGLCHRFCSEGGWS